MATLAFLLGIGITSGIAIARRAKDFNAGGIKLFKRRSTLYNLNRFKVITDGETASLINNLKHKYKILTVPEPVVLSGRPETDDKILYYGPFKTNMTKKEARLIMGLSPSEAKDKKIVNSQFRKLMLKNHPDTGGSLYVASKINEAKDILTESKKAEEGEDEEFVVDIDEISSQDEFEASKKRKENLSKLAQQGGIEDKEKLLDTEIDPFPQVKPVRQKKAIQIHEEILNEDIDYRPHKMAIQEDYETMFERKLKRISPILSREEHTSWQPEENWKIEYINRIKQLKKLENFAQKKQWIIEEYDDGTYMVKNNKNQPLKIQNIYYEEEARMKSEIPKMESLLYDQYENYEKEQEEIFRIQLDRLKSSKKRMANFEEFYKSIEENNEENKN